MRINVANGKATICMVVPVFVGTTGSCGALGYFDPVGTSLTCFQCAPKFGESGTLVFDHPDPTQRGPRTPTYLHYFWPDDKLRVEEELNRKALRRGFVLESTGGLAYYEKDRTYRPHKADTHVPTMHVDIFDLLRFLEGKITLDELDAKVIND